MSEQVNTFSAPSAPLGEQSLLDELRSEFAVPLKTDILKLPIPERPHFSVVYDTRISWESAKKIAAQATDAKTKEVDLLKQSAMVLATQCMQIERNDEPLKDDLGDLLTFRSKVFIDSTGAFDTTEALKIFFGRDGDVISHYVKINDRNSFDREAKDPFV